MVVRAAVLAAALSTFVVSVLAAGCGGESTATAAPLSPAQWRGQANRICARYSRQIQRFPQPKSESDIAEFIAGVAPLWRRQSDALRTLRPPAELAGPATTYVINLDYLAKWLVELHVARQRNDGARSGAAVNKIQDSAQSAKGWAERLRLRACARQRIP